MPGAGLGFMTRPGTCTSAIAGISQRTFLISQGCWVWIMMLTPPVVESTMREHIQSYHQYSPGFQTVQCDRSGGYCLWLAWLLCTPGPGQPLQRRAAEKCQPFIPKCPKSTGVSPEQGVLLIYDIACQYYVHLHDRIRSQLPFGLDIDMAIGLFHVHAHKDQCFFQYASSFIPGAVIVVGEILESLWSSLNAISPTAHTARLTSAQG